MKLLLLFTLSALAVATVAAATELKIDVTHTPASCVRKSKHGDTLSMHYTGTLANGNKFDSSRDRGQPFKFKFGAGQVIKGWDEGLKDMCVGEKRILTIPPAMGYGSRAMGDKIPANSVLVFDVELMGIN